MACPVLTYPDPTAVDLRCLNDTRSIWLWEGWFEPDSVMEFLIFQRIFAVYGLVLLLSSLAGCYAIPSSRTYKCLHHLLSSTSLPWPYHTIHLPLPIPQIFKLIDHTILNFANCRLGKACNLYARAQELLAERKGRLVWLDAFRVFGMVWVFGNHLGSEGRIDILERLPKAKAYKDAIHNHLLVGAFFGNSALGVEIFLCLSSLLSVGSFARIAQTYRTVSGWVVYITRRSLRLWLAVLCFLIIAVSPQLRALLPRFYATMATACGWKGVLAHLTFTANYQREPTCFGYLWYLGMDAQLHLFFVPLLVTGLLDRGWRFRTQLAIGALVVGSMIWRAVVCLSFGKCHMSDVDIPFIHVASLSGDEMRGMYHGLWYKYGGVRTKMGPFLMATIVGFWEQQGVKISIRKSRALFWGGLIGAVVVTYAILPQYWYPSMPSSHPYNYLYTATFRTAFAACLLSMICSFILLERPPKCPHWISVGAKLCFSAYLCHMPCAYVFNYWNSFQEIESALPLLFPFWPLHTILSFGVAFLFYITVEGPMTQLARH